MRGSKCLILIAFKCIVLELVPLRGKKCLDHAHKMEFWYLGGLLFKLSDNHPRQLYMGVPPPPPPAPLVLVFFTGLTRPYIGKFRALRSFD